MPFRLSLFIVVTLFIFSAFSLESDLQQPFSNRIIFSQTPEIGEKWHGGIRMNDFLIWDAYWNCGDLFSLDFFRAGVKKMSLPDDNGDTITLTDLLTLFSVKSRPVQTKLWNNPYSLAGGGTIQSSAFDFKNQIGEGIAGQPSSELALFATQSWFLYSRHFNLMTMASFMKTDGMEKTVTSVYLVPGYRCFIGQKKSWSLDIEYYLMNPVELPYKTIQYGFDPENNEFYNPDQLFVSFTFWGFSYSRKHLRLELHLGHHISFAGPILPMIGMGWNF